MRVPIDQDVFAEAGLWLNVADGTFHLLDPTTGEPLDHWECRVLIDGTDAVFYPRRSSSQCAVLDRLGVGY